MTGNCVANRTLVWGRRQVCKLTAASVLALSAGGASAQDDSSAAETAAARSLALEGIKLADAGRCEDAIEKLERAERLHHAPVVLGRLGECQISEGKLVEGTENLRKVLREALPPNAPAVLLKARERAQSVLERTKGRIGALNITVKGPAEHSAVTVVIDGQPMNSALLEADRPTDPGEHVIEASAPGFLSASARTSVSAGEKQRVVISLEPDPSAAAGSSMSPEPSAPPSTREVPSTRDGAAPFTRTYPVDQPRGFAADVDADAGEREPDRTAAYIAWAAGGGAIVAGSIFGVMAMNGKSELDSQCVQKVCPASAQDQLDSAKSSGTLATVLFAVGGTGLALGTILYFTASPSEEESAQGGAAEGVAGADTGLRARAWVGLGQVGVSGEF